MSTGVGWDTWQGDVRGRGGVGMRDILVLQADTTLLSLIFY